MINDVRRKSIIIRGAVTLYFRRTINETRAVHCVREGIVLIKKSDSIYSRRGAESAIVFCSDFWFLVFFFFGSTAMAPPRSSSHARVVKVLFSKRRTPRRHGDITGRVKRGMRVPAVTAASEGVGRTGREE